MLSVNLTSQWLVWHHCLIPWKPWSSARIQGNTGGREEGVHSRESKLLRNSSNSNSNIHQKEKLWLEKENSLRSFRLSEGSLEEMLAKSRRQELRRNTRKGKLRSFFRSGSSRRSRQDEGLREEGHSEECEEVGWWWWESAVCSIKKLWWSKNFSVKREEDDIEPGGIITTKSGGERVPWEIGKNPSESRYLHSRNRPESKAVAVLEIFYGY